VEIRRFTGMAMAFGMARPQRHDLQHVAKDGHGQDGDSIAEGWRTMRFRRGDLLVDLVKD
jgi:hypothetical protein